MVQLVLSDDDNCATIAHVATSRTRLQISCELVQDVLRPRSFDEFVTYGFDDPPPR